MARPGERPSGGYVASVKSTGAGQARTAVYLTHAGRAALERYSTALRQLLDQANT
jgi:hypothetical protein